MLISDVSSDVSSSDLSELDSPRYSATWTVHRTTARSGCTWAPRLPGSPLFACPRSPTAPAFAGTGVALPSVRAEFKARWSVDREPPVVSDRSARVAPGHAGGRFPGRLRSLPQAAGAVPRLAVSTFTPGPMVELTDTRLM